MALLPIGSDKILEIHTGKVNIVIKSKKQQTFLNPDEILSQDSSLEVRASALEQVTVLGSEQAVGDGSVGVSVYHFNVCPLFFEQTDYEIIIESRDREPVSFWHENFNVREKVSPVTESNPGLLTGVINFGNSVGYSDFEISVAGVRHAVIRIEVFPSKITYKEDYRNMLSDISDEIYSVAIDFLKQTYLQFQIGDRQNTVPAIFFQIIKAIFDQFVRAINRIIAVPHHQLVIDHRVMPSYRAKTIDGKGEKWLIQHPEYVQKGTDGVRAEKVLAAQKQISYDTTENRFAKFILESTAKKLADFRKRYTETEEHPDTAVLRDADSMLGTVRQLISGSFLSSVSEYRSTQSMSLVFGMAPGYRELYKYYLMLHRGLSVNGDVFRISMKDTAQLYEYWCFIKLVSILKNTTYRRNDGKVEKKYKLVSPDIIKVDNSGITVTLVKGKKSEIRFLNVTTGEQISLTYNPGEQSTQTVNQKPDNVLTLEKTGSEVPYKYVFDAKYRIESQPGDFYPDKNPGPKLDDINTMHRYRDSIVYENTNPTRFTFEKTMFGAYILFPYSNEDLYEEHRFYKSIDSVNIGGLPFLPGATRLVESFLSELISDSEESAFERASLPRGIETKLAKVDWNANDVMVGSFRNEEQFNINYREKFYYTRASIVPQDKLPIHYVAMYRPKYWSNPGVKYYGEVTETSVVRRKEIPVPMRNRNNAEELYYLFRIKEWKELPVSIEVKEEGPREPKYTNLFLLKNCRQTYELFNIHSEEQYRLVYELRRIFNDTSVNENATSHEPVIQIDAHHVTWARGGFFDLCNSRGEIIEQIRITDFAKHPRMFFEKIKSNLK